MTKYEKFYVKNMQDTDILCAIVDHEDKLIHLEQDASATNMVGYCRRMYCQHLIDANYTQVWRNLDNYVADNNIQ
jgi:hypothetical protein